MASQAAVDAVLLHPDDNVCVAARDLRAGTVVALAGRRCRVREPVKLGHKIALASIPAGAPVIKYGQTIGIATRAVGIGDWVHTHNLAIGELAHEYAPASRTPPPPEPIQDRTFQGYVRPDGRVGTRNYIAVISTVNCSASVARFIARRFDPSRLKDFPNIDGVIALAHGSGCGMPLGAEGHQMLDRVLGGFARHPNVGAYILVGLGCEQSGAEHLVDCQQLARIDGATGSRIAPPVFTIQACGGTVKTVEAAVGAIAELLPQVNGMARQTVPASALVLATECGGSDGNSGITANPAVGVACDLVVACGGTAILSETPEIFGAEHLLARRAVSEEVAGKLIERIAWWKRYVGAFGAALDNNPSVGNKEGGLTTIAEKSLGAVAKAGSTALVDVYRYAEPVTAKGLVVMDTPGFDPPSVVGMVAGGANVVVFTTGRGSCYGSKPVPTIKVASNTPMYERMIDDMDINAGEILAGRTVRAVGRAVFEEILAVASGKKTKSEIHGIGDEEFVPWIVGPML